MLKACSLNTRRVTKNKVCNLSFSEQRCTAPSGDSRCLVVDDSPPPQDIGPFINEQTTKAVIPTPPHKPRMTDPHRNSDYFNQRHPGSRRTKPRSAGSLMLVKTTDQLERHCSQPSSFWPGSHCQLGTGKPPRCCPPWPDSPVV